MFIHNFAVKNFMIHKNTKVDLYPITVLVGNNNAGKSAFFDALLNFSMVSRGQLSQAFGAGPSSYMALRHHGAGATAQITFEVMLSESVESAKKLHYRISYGRRARENAFSIYQETLRDA